MRYVKLKLIILTTVLQLVLSMISLAESQTYYVRVYFKDAIVNGLSLSADNPQVNVSKGERIKGFLEVIVENNRGGAWITPVVGVNSWDRKFYQCLTGDAPDGMSTHKFEFDFVAPNKNGTYYIAVFAGWWYSCEELVSNDHPPKFGDGDDVWDMPKESWEKVIIQGRSEGFYHEAGRGIRIIVGSGASEEGPSIWNYLFTIFGVAALGGVFSFLIYKKRSTVRAGKSEERFLSENEQRILSYLREHNFTISISRCANELGLSEETVKEVLRSLKNKGIIDFNNL